MPDHRKQLPIAVSVGDPAGIGPDIIIECWRRRSAEPLPPFYVLADPRQLRQRAAMLGADVPVRSVEPERAAETFPDALPVVALSKQFNDACGTIDSSNAPGIIEAIDRGVADAVGGRASALVTAPISKKTLYDAGFRHPGHTEYLGALAERIAGAPAQPVMMLAGPKLKVVPVTIHIPLADVPAALTGELIVQTGATVAHDLRTRFGIERPRLAIAGLNPHAGESGALGLEDDVVVRPAVETLAARGLTVRGPLPADTMFHDRARAQYDAAICMYHDQALIPAKALGFDDSVNVTLGLPFIRTSPDHGTAFDIAGSGKAEPASMVAALRMAAAMAEHSRAVVVS
ncbi:4-hydroxythreonine-4-phosphate dehydrogenase PdxA [Oricola sp.]|uniref:4-hydroxythreonine-4-phosphate dehydrogenase PdxA n=1 Tax=Oricola sp. TaxID=1979950 RepID=UPI003BAAED5D